MKKISYIKGFTLIELLVVVAIIGILASVVLAALGSARDKATEGKIQSELKSMLSQAQLYTGAVGTVVAPTASTTGVTGVASGNLFTSTTATDNSLYNLISRLPGGVTAIYYAWDGTSPLNGGKWFFATSGPNNVTCLDYTSVLKVKPGSASTAAQFKAPAFFQNATVTGGYICS